jgi:hypothetical protein
LSLPTGASPATASAQDSNMKIESEVMTSAKPPSSTPNGDSDLVSCRALNEINDLAAS